MLKFEYASAMKPKAIKMCGGKTSSGGGMMWIEKEAFVRWFVSVYSDDDDDEFGWSGLGGSGLA